jgi:hypothetical protein
MTITWQNTAGEWIDFPENEVQNILHQKASNALIMLASFLPVVAKIEDGYICTKGIYPQIRKRHKKCVTFDTLYKKFQHSEKPLYEALEIGTYNEYA